MKYIHEQVVAEVLVRLPVKSLLRSRCVCKGWYAMIESAHFIDLHLRHPCREKQSTEYMILDGVVLPAKLDLWRHIKRLPSGYLNGYKYKLERYEEVLLHMKLLEKVRNRSNDKRYKPACAVRPMEMEFRPMKMNGRIHYGPRYEIIYSTDDQCGLHKSLSSLLESRRLRFEYLRMFLTVDGYCLLIFVVYGWPADGGVDTLRKAVKENVHKIWQLRRGMLL